MVKTIIYMDLNIHFEKKNKFMFMYFCTYNHFNGLKNLLEVHDSEHNNKYRFINGFRIACLNNNQEIAKYLIDNVNGIDFDESFSAACGTGNIDIVKYLSNKKKPNINFINDASFRVACRNQHINIMDFLLNIPYNNIDVNALGEALIYSCKKGYINVVKFLYNDTNININIINNKAFMIACHNGHIDIVKYLIDIPNNNIDINTSNNFPIMSACKNGHIEIIKFLHTIKPNNYIFQKYDLYHMACINKHVDIFDFLFTVGSMYNKKSNMLRLLRNSCNNGCINNIKFLFEYNNEYFVSNMYEERCFFLACKKGHLNVVKYLTNIDNLINHSDVFNKLFSYGTYHCEIEVFKYLISIHDNNKFVNHKFIEKLCCHDENYEIAKYIIGIPENNINIDHDKIFKYSCVFGNFNIIDVFLNVKDNGINIYDHAERMFLSSCKKGKFDMIKKLFDDDHNINDYVSKYNFRNGFNSACQFGYFEIVKYLFDIYEKGIIYDENIINGDNYIINDKTFQSACKSGNIDSVKFLLDVQENIIDINNNNNKAFLYACDSKNIHLLEFLFNVPGNDYLSECYNICFDVFCSRFKFNLNIIIFLLDAPNNNINIRKNNDFAFRQSCEYKAADVALYFCEKIEDYNVEVKNGKIINWSILFSPKEKKQLDGVIVECPICFEIESDIITDCNHQLCIKCCQHIHKKNVCHMCRNNIKKYYLIETVSISDK
jgi:ankyrin repeat protein